MAGDVADREHHGAVGERDRGEPVAADLDRALGRQVRDVGADAAQLEGFLGDGQQRALQPPRQDVLGVQRPLLRAERAVGLVEGDLAVAQVGQVLEEAVHHHGRALGVGDGLGDHPQVAGAVGGADTEGRVDRFAPFEQRVHRGAHGGDVLGEEVLRQLVERHRPECRVPVEDRVHLRRPAQVVRDQVPVGPAEVAQVLQAAQPFDLPVGRIVPQPGDDEGIAQARHGHGVGGGPRYAGGHLVVFEEVALERLTGREGLQVSVPERGAGHRRVALQDAPPDQFAPRAPGHVHRGGGGRLDAEVGHLALRAPYGDEEDGGLVQGVEDGLDGRRPGHGGDG
ncbi:hypothetical protein OH779_34870 [Actinacidiphila glaucinigra]